MSGFPSLSGADTGASSDDSFWPSFTDIMMVIVMIFLISTVFLLLKNWELISELRTSIEAERAARIEISAATEENLSLEERVAALETLLNQAQLTSKRERERAETAQAQAETLLTQLSASQQEAQLNREQLDSVNLENQGLLQQLEKMRQSLAAATSEVEQQTARADRNATALGEAQQTISSLNEKTNTQQEQLSSLTAEKLALDRSLAGLTDEYSQLKVRYDKLVKPARTTKGKAIVAVRYDKNSQNGYESLSIKLPDADSFKPVTAEEMHDSLNALKETLGDKLYVRIIFPEGNDLSYAEALNFTTELLNQYDYYYQK
ncbi:MAG: hypothetical protein ACWA44_13210 [Thiotrichales bacterium]